VRVRRVWGFGGLGRGLGLKVQGSRLRVTGYGYTKPCVHYSDREGWRGTECHVCEVDGSTCNARAVAAKSC
jgi:hypothetical protein